MMTNQCILRKINLSRKLNRINTKEHTHLLELETDNEGILRLVFTYLQCEESILQHCPSIHPEFKQQ